MLKTQGLSNEQFRSSKPWQCARALKLKQSVIIHFIIYTIDMSECEKVKRAYGLSQRAKGLCINAG